jgi:hypothetical protein
MGVYLHMRRFPPTIPRVDGSVKPKDFDNGIQNNVAKPVAVSVCDGILGCKLMHRLRKNQQLEKL